MTVSGTSADPDRRVIVLADAKLKGSKQPFHAAESRPHKQAEELIARCRESAWTLARRGLDEICGACQIGACGILLSSARPLPELAAILASHALIQTAEGEFFREAIRDAGLARGLPVPGLVRATLKKETRLSHDYRRTLGKNHAESGYAHENPSG